MKMSLAVTLLGSLMVATALTPVGAADMTQERALNAGKEPQNWLLHYNNYEGHRFSQLKEINLDTVKNLKPVFSVALDGIEGAGARNKSGNLEATPIVEDGIMYVTNGWGVVYAYDVDDTPAVGDVHDAVLDDRGRLEIAGLVARAGALDAIERDTEHRLQVLHRVEIDLLELGEPMALVVVVVQQPVLWLLASIEG